MKKVKRLIVLLLFMATYSVIAQIAINTDGSAPDGSAILDVKSTTMGLLLPRLTNEQRDDIVAPATGLMIFNTEQQLIQVYDGTNWSSFEHIWTCGNKYLDARNGQSYNTVQIGTQCWMAENINLGTRINGANEQTNNSIIEKYCYDDNETNCNTYGGLYQWNEMMQYVTTEGTQGICPTGWHLPTDDEWKTMELYLGMSQSEADDIGWRGTDEGGKMKETGTTHWNSPNTGATNSSNFTALPGGYRYSNGSFSGLGYYGDWWASTGGSGTYAWTRTLNFDYDQVHRNNPNKTNGFSVRCLKN